LYIASKNNPSTGCNCVSTVLVAEDEYFNIYFITEKFDAIGLFYDIAGNGRIAFEMYKKNMEKKCCEIKYKIFFCDMRMPEMDGKTTAVEIKKYNREKSLSKFPIIASTAFTRHDMEEELRTRLFTDLITKPYNKDDFKNIIH
jgi:CheY-like chemotaxis protein